MFDVVSVLIVLEVSVEELFVVVVFDGLQLNMQAATATVITINKRFINSSIFK